MARLNRTSQGLTEARSIVAELCGEVPLEGFGQWRQRFEHDHVVS